MIDDAETELLAANAELLRRREALAKKAAAAEYMRSKELLPENGVSRAPGGAAAPLPQFLQSVMRAIKRERKNSRVDVIDEYAAAWQRINTETVRQATANIAYRNGFLTITVTNPAIKYELASFSAPTLLAAIRQALPHVTIRGLKFKCGAEKK